MRSTQLITGALAVVATSSLIGLGSTAQAATQADPTTTVEKGVAIACNGEWRDKHVYAEVYENSLHGNHVEVAIDDGVHAASRWQEERMVTGKRVGVQVRLDGSAAQITGLARLDGTRTPVHEVLEDAGQTIESTGVQRGLETDVSFIWRGRTAHLDCSDAFRYRVSVTRTPIG